MESVLCVRASVTRSYEWDKLWPFELYIHFRVLRLKATKYPSPLGFGTKTKQNGRTNEEGKRNWHKYKVTRANFLRRRAVYTDAQ